MSAFSGSGTAHGRGSEPTRSATVHAASKVAVWQLADLRIELGPQRVSRGEEEIALPKLSFDLLVTLLRAAPDVLSQHELMDRVWPGVVVSPETVSQRIKLLRDALGDDPKQPRYIAGLRGRGYRIVAEVRALAVVDGAEGVAASTSPSRSNSIRITFLPMAVAGVVLAAMIGYLWIGQDRAIESRTREVPPNSVAVLPFADFSESGDQEWFAAGLTDEILTSLARLPELKVTGRTSSFQFKDQNRSIGEIAAILGVANIVEGSIRRFGDHLRVTAQLVRAADGFHLWSGAYDGTTSDLFSVQRNLAEQIASALGVVLDEKRRERMFHSGTQNVEAFEAYQKGLGVFNAVHKVETNLTLWIANEYFQRAMTLDPGYAEPAIAQIDAFAHLLMDGEGGLVADARYSQDEALALLLHNLDSAITKISDPTTRLVAAINRELFSPSWYRMAGLIQQLRKEWGINRTAPGLWSDDILLVSGNHDLKRAFDNQRLADDPLDPDAWKAKANIELHAGNLELAREFIMEGRRVAGDHELLREVEIITAIFQRRREEVIELLSGNEERAWYPVYLAAVKGDYEIAVRLADEIQMQHEQPVESLLLAYHEMRAAERTRALVRRLDELPAGSVIFIRLLSVNGNALIFDLEDTPNFTARLRQADISPTTFRRLPRLSD